MSADEEKDVAGETPAEPAAAKKPPAVDQPPAKKAAAEKAASEKKPAAAKKPAARKAAAEKAPAAEAEAAAAEQPAGDDEKPPKKRAVKKTVAKKAAAAKEPAVAAKESADAKPKLARRRAAPSAKQAPRRRVVRAHARYVRTSARKARMVCGHLRGKSVGEARAILAFTPREVARNWSKLLESAIANAESNHELLEDDLIVREAYADEGPTIKRFRPRAMGRATPILKRTSHLTITLSPRPELGTTKRHG